MYQLAILFQILWLISSDKIVAAPAVDGAPVTASYVNIKNGKNPAFEQATARN